MAGAAGRQLRAVWLPEPTLRPGPGAAGVGAEQRWPSLSPGRSSAIRPPHADRGPRRGRGRSPAGCGARPGPCGRGSPGVPVRRAQRSQPGPPPRSSPPDPFPGTRGPACPSFPQSAVWTVWGDLGGPTRGCRGAGASAGQGRRRQAGRPLTPSPRKARDWSARSASEAGDVQKTGCGWDRETQERDTGNRPPNTDLKSCGPWSRTGHPVRRARGKPQLAPPQPKPARSQRRRVQPPRWGGNSGSRQSFTP